MHDIVTATAAAAEHGQLGSAYNIGGGSRRSMNDVLGLVGEILGSPVERQYHGRQAGDARDTAADIRRARRDLGFEPSGDLETGLRAQLEWQQASLQVAPS